MRGRVNSLRGRLRPPTILPYCLCSAAQIGGLSPLSGTRDIGRRYAEVRVSCQEGYGCTPAIATFCRELDPHSHAIPSPSPSRRSGRLRQSAPARAQPGCLLSRQHSPDLAATRPSFLLRRGGCHDGRSATMRIFLVAGFRLSTRWRRRLCRLASPAASVTVSKRLR